MRYWVCQTCKYGQVSEIKPTVCLECGETNGKWKSSDVTNMLSFRMYKCTKCEHTVEERTKPNYPCDFCGNTNWEIFKLF